ncbi:MAG: DUF1570 domain-containing protein [Planctomycetia bacterium]|nr:DUF1570 domain-containing protein [Planctomycetia bacterium]
MKKMILYFLLISLGNFWVSSFSEKCYAQLSTYAEPTNKFIQRRDKYLKEYQDKLNALAQKCNSQGLKREAEITQKWLSSRSADKIFVAVLPTEYNPSLTGKNPTPEQLKWEEEFTDLRKDASNFFYKQAQLAVDAKHPSLGFDLLMDALRENPDHASARKIVGFQKYQNEWRTAYEVRQLKKRRVKHPKFGWIPKNHVEKYEQGQRFYNKKWISKEEDAAAHQDINNGWIIETAHYSICTNHSLEEGVKLADELESLYRVWKQLFLRYFASEKEVTQLFAGKGALKSTSRKHKVVFFRSRNDYISTLASRNPNVQMSSGIYIISAKPQEPGVAYFYYEPGSDRRTMFHEATHQLFAEVPQEIAKSVGRNHNFWIVEGIATYMETLAHEPGYHVLGGFNDQRMMAARLRYCKTKFYIPLTKLCSMSAAEFQGHPKVAQLYSQCAGLTHFMIYYKNGEYRDGLVEYLRTVYRQEDTPQTLSNILSKSYSELDKEYGQFISQQKTVLNELDFRKR